MSHFSQSPRQKAHHLSDNWAFKEKIFSFKSLLYTFFRFPSKEFLSPGSLEQLPVREELFSTALLSMFVQVPGKIALLQAPNRKTCG